MKKIFTLFVFALIAMAAGAQNPLYTIKGVVTNDASWGYEYENSFVFKGTPVEVEVYDEDYVIIKNWAGAQGCDLKVEYDPNADLNDENCYGNIFALTSIINGVEQEPLTYTKTEDGYTYNYVDLATGREDYSVASTTLNEDGTFYWSFVEVDKENQTGYVQLTAYFMTADYSSWLSEGYYYAEWPQKADGPLYTVETIPTCTRATGSTFPNVDKVKVEVYDGNSVIIRAFAGVEGYDMRIDYTDEGIAHIASIVNGEVWNEGTGTSVYCKTGFTGEGECEYFRAYLASNYSTINISETAGELSLRGYSYATGKVTVTKNEDGTTKISGSGGAWDKYELYWEVKDPSQKEAELVYKSKGRIMINPEYSEDYDYLFDGTDVDIEVYDDNSIIVRGYAGVKGYDLRAWYNEDAIVTGIAYITNGAQGKKTTSGYAGYQATGIDNYAYNIYIADDGSATGYSDNEEKTGYLFLSGYDYDYNTSANTEKYYYVEWPFEGAEITPIYTATGEFVADEEYVASNYGFLMVGNKVGIEVYDDNSIIVRNFAGVEGHDLKVLYDEEENVTGLAAIINGAEGEVTTSGYFQYSPGDGNTYNIYLAADYCYAASYNDAKEGYIFLYVYNENNEGDYFNIVWPAEGTDGINNAIVDVTNSYATFNLAGQRVSNSFKGIVIKNGKKVLVK